MGEARFCDGAWFVFIYLATSMASPLYEPPPRWGHFSSIVEGNLLMYGGRTKDFFNQVENTISLFNPYEEKWTTHISTGHPIRIYSGASTALGSNYYLYGGSDGCYLLGCLYQFDSTWTILKEYDYHNNAPMRKVACRMINHGEKLICSGGYGITSGPHQFQSQFVLDNKYEDGRGWTNELHSFDLKEGEVEY